MRLLFPWRFQRFDIADTRSHELQLLLQGREHAGAKSVLRKRPT